MKKLLIAAVCLTGAFSLSAQACPTGTHPVGGSGAHHKGGTCVANHKNSTHTHHNAKSAKKPSHETQQRRNNVQPEQPQPPMNKTVDQTPGHDH